MNSTTRRGQLSPVWFVLFSMISVQFGSALGKSIFGTVSPLAVTWLRLFSAAAILLLVARPKLRGHTRSEWLVLLAFGSCLVIMNLSIYHSFQRIPIGLAVTIEFLGPLSVALLNSRQFKDVLWAVIAAIGVALLSAAPARLDWLGMGLALIAAACWAGYIVIGERLSRSWRPAHSLAFSCAIGGVALAIPTIVVDGGAVWDWRVLTVGLGVGLLSTVIPYTLELTALQRLPKRVFSILMSVEPALAAAAGFLVLRERLTALQLAAMVCVIIASFGSTRNPAEPESLGA